MQLYQLADAGFPGLKLAEQDVPQPGTGQVLVRMRAASLNYRDLIISKGASNGLVPLSDGVGEVERVGDGVTRVRRGDRVAGIFYQDWIDGPMKEGDFASGLGGGTVNGTLTQYRLFDAERVVTIPDHLSWVEAATLPCAGVTAWNALLGLQPGQTVLTLGTGGVSIFALQLAIAMGASVIATSSSAHKEERLIKLGAKATINYREREDWGQVAREMTGGAGVDRVIEVGGGGTLANSFAATRQSGEVDLIGVLTGGPVNTIPVLMKALVLRGIQVGSRAMFEDMNAFIAAHRLHPVVDRVFPFAEAKDAYDYQMSGQHFGKVVIDIA
jgi:NADPH:quinone reductase-like Zn-dependent oxidoreductase